MATTKKTQGASAKELLANLTKGKKPTIVTSETKANRPEMELSDEGREAYRRFGGLVELFNKIKSRLNLEKEIVDEECFSKWTTWLFKSQTRPANPLLEVTTDEGKPDVEGIFQVQERFSLQLDKKNPEESVTHALTTAFLVTGMGAEEATQKAVDLVANELIVVPKPIIDLNKLGEGHWEGEGKNKTFVEATQKQQEIVSKLIRHIQARSNKDLLEAGLFTDEEQEQLLEYQPQNKVKTGFLSRVCKYVNSATQLLEVFKIIKPVHFPEANKFAISDNAKEKQSRLLQIVQDIVGTSE